MSQWHAVSVEVAYKTWRVRKEDQNWANSARPKRAELAVAP